MINNSGGTIDNIDATIENNGSIWNHGVIHTNSPSIQQITGTETITCNQPQG
jgi:hypothetical protein